MSEKPALPYIRVICSECFGDAAICGHQGQWNIYIYDCPRCAGIGGQTDTDNVWQPCTLCKGAKEIPSFDPTGCGFSENLEESSDASRNVPPDKP